MSAALALAWLLLQAPVPASTTAGEAAQPTLRADCVGEDGQPLSSFARPDVREVAERITCYCGCPHLQVSKCYCGTADAIREDIAAQLDAGRTPDEIVAAYVAEHGTWELAVPPREGFNWSIWLLPVALVLLGGAAVFVLGRRWVRPPRPSPQPVPDESLDDESHARHRAELARAVDAGE